MKKNSFLWKQPYFKIGWKTEEETNLWGVATFIFLSNFISRPWYFNIEVKFWSRHFILRSTHAVLKDLAMFKPCAHMKWPHSPYHPIYYIFPFSLISLMRLAVLWQAVDQKWCALLELKQVSNLTKNLWKTSRSFCETWSAITSQSLQKYFPPLSGTET